VKSVHVLVLTIEWSYYVHGTVAIIIFTLFTIRWVVCVQLMLRLVASRVVIRCVPDPLW